MSERYEQAIQTWYDRSRTANLEYLDLSENSKISRRDLSNNLDCIYDKLLLHSKVSIKDFHKTIEILREQHQEQQSVILHLQEDIKQLKATFEAHKPLTAQAVKKLVQEIAQQPKLVEEQALALTAKLEQQLAEVHSVVQEVKTFLYT